MRSFPIHAVKPTLIGLGLGAACLALAACSGFAGSPAPTTALSAGLSARMDQPGANLNRGEAIGIINAYRATTGAQALGGDATLDQTAQALASQYASSGTAPRTPDGVVAIRLSAGYATFADTFSGWRNRAEDARVLADARARRAGVAVAFNPSSTYGVHWVLVLDD